VVMVSMSEEKKGGRWFGWMKRIEVEEVYVFLMMVLLGIFVGMTATSFLVSVVQFVLKN
jgi:hypothetical protein